MSETLIGAIVGAAAAIIGAIVGGLLAESVKDARLIKRINRAHLVKGCEDAKKLIFLMLTDSSQISDELIAQVKIKLSIFASKEIGESFNRILINIRRGTPIEGEVNAFNLLIKKELRVK